MTKLQSLYQEFDKITGYHFEACWTRQMGVGFDIIGLSKIIDEKTKYFDKDGVSLADATAQIHGERARKILGEILAREKNGEY